MKVKPAPSVNETHAFSEALSRVVSLSRAEMLKPTKTVSEVPVSRHKRYKYVPAKPQTNS